jgi:hypothetical protein
MMESKAVTSPQDYFAVTGYAAFIKRNIDLATAKKLGTKAASMCKSMGYVTGQIPDPRFGRVKTYPREVLETVFTQG